MSLVNLVTIIKVHLSILSPFKFTGLSAEMKRQEGGADGGAVGPDPCSPSRKGLHMYEDPYEEGPGAVAGAHFPSASRDRRPREDYDEPWEWSAKQAMFQAQMENVVGSESQQPAQNKTPLMTPKRTKPQGEGASEGEAGPAQVPDVAPKIDGEKHPANGIEQSHAPPPQQNGPKPVSTGEGAGEEEGCPRSHKELASGEGAQNPHPPPHAGPRSPAPSHPTGQQKRDTRVGNYEEPWDLSSTQKDLEDKIKAASISGGGGGGAGPPSGGGGAGIAGPSSDQTNGDRASREQGASGGGPPPHKSDSRPMEGYEKPWDWKPHRKDDRGQEGYEKPWDWKPHQKDDRPMEEYEEPWDNKAIEELGLPPSSSEVPDRDAHSSPGASGGGTPPPGTSRAGDARPAEEYDEPWDQRKNKNFLTRTGNIWINVHYLLVPTLRD